MSTHPSIRASRWRGFIAGAAFAVTAVINSAQTTVPAEKPEEPEPAAPESVVQLSKFEVVTTQSKGYVANNAATGFKTNQELIKIPQMVTVVTRDLIEDIGATKTSDVLQYAGASQFYRGESIRLRGARVLNSYLDDAIENVPYSDNVNIDAYEIIRGPAGVLYANAGLGGVVLKSSRKPLPYAYSRLSLSLKDYGAYRTELDTTGPMGEWGGAKLGYRVTAAFQGGDSYLKNVKDDRVSVHPTLQAQLKNTTVRFAVDYTDLDSIAGAQNFALPDGSIYTGAGRDEGYYARGIMENHRQIRERVAVLQKLSDNWESKTSLSHLKYERKGTNLLPLSLNLSTNTFNLFARRNYQRQENWVVNQDFLGNYNIAAVANQTAAGFTLTDEYVRSSFINANGATTGPITAPLFGTGGSQGFAIAQPKLDAVTVPAYADYGSPSAVGSWTNNRRSTYYFQQQAEVIPNRLTLVAGWSYATLQINDVPAVFARTTAGGTRIVNFDEKLHRYGVVLNLTKDIALYALDSTTFAPQGNSNTRDIAGVLLPAQVGSGQEVGLKTALRGGRISATLAYFDMELTNVAVLQAGLSPVTGIAYFTAAGLQKQKGWDASLAIAPTDNWQLLATAYQGEVNDQNGVQLNNTYRSLYSFFTRYDFKDGALKGFAFGGGASKTGGNYFSTPGGYVFPAGVTPGPVTLQAAWNTNVFATYRHGKHWTFRLNVENVLDETYALGAQSVLAVDVSPPRTFQLAADYKF